MSASASPSPDVRARVALAVALGALAVGLSYVVQRLWDAADEPPLTEVRKMAITPYYWRVGIALVHGVVVASLAGVAHQGRGIRPWRWVAGFGLTLAVVGTAAMLWVP